ncbi:MAG TPA: hypothetical protein V6D03_10550, partial [Candidatus Caenarcaniphilales bacterium]
VKPNYSFHFVSTESDGLVSEIQDIKRCDIWINGGYFLFKKEIFKYINSGEELVHQPFKRLIEKEELFGQKHHGFWACMDTFKEKQYLDDVYSQGNAPWQVWKTQAELKL